jgi:lysophospholipase L1-like esterase
MQILIFGDSLTYGAWDKEGGWVQRLRKYIDEKYPQKHEIYNLGVSGDTSKDILERFEIETKARWWQTPHVIIFQIGTNDSALLASKRNSEWVSPKEFERNVRKLIFEARKITEKVFFVSEPSVEEKKTRPVPWAKDVSYTNDNIRKYNEIVKEICDKEKIGFIDILPDFKKQDIGQLLQDGVHPTNSGHEIIFRTVRDFLVKNKVI